MVVQQQYITADRFLEMVEQPQYQDRVLELVEGAIVDMSKPTWKHGVITMRLAVKIANHVDANELGVVTAADTGFILERSPHGRDTVRGLDIAFVQKSRTLDPPEYIWYDMGPDLAVEVISPNNSTADTHLKVTQLLNAGTRLIWVVYPENRSVVAHTSSGAKTLYEDETLSGGDVLPGFELRVGDIFPS
ncbi:MAG: Uma2 family endonuclease [Chloroflexi bacterium]|nr:Uma2 family endonuclease [Chloroflexota bacterium]